MRGVWHQGIERTLNVLTLIGHGVSDLGEKIGLEQQADPGLDCQDEAGDESSRFTRSELKSNWVEAAVNVSCACKVTPFRQAQGRTASVQSNCLDIIGSQPNESKKEHAKMETTEGSYLVYP